MKKTKQSKETKKDDQKNLYLRTIADLENYKRRTESEKKNWTDQAKAELLGELLPLLDNLSLMSEHTPEELKENPWVKGVDIVFNQIESTLQEQGIEKILPQKGSNFDPAFQEAISVEPSELPEGSIVKVQKPGYKIKEKIIRAAQVVTSSGANQRGYHARN